MGGTETEISFSDRPRARDIRLGLRELQQTTQITTLAFEIGSRQSLIRYSSFSEKLSFNDDQLKWFEDRLASDANSADVKTVVVGMHAALPDSISRDHRMNESED